MEVLTATFSTTADREPFLSDARGKIPKNTASHISRGMVAKFFNVTYAATGYKFARISAWSITLVPVRSAGLICQQLLGHRTNAEGFGDRTCVWFSHAGIYAIDSLNR